MDKNRKFYDEAFMEIFSNKKIVKSLLEDFIDELWVHLIDFATMEVSKSMFKGISDSKKESDLLLRFSLKHNQENLYIFILMEFQSTAKPIILRLLEYITRIYKNQKTTKKTLYPVIPIVLYNGKDKWREKNNLSDHFSHLPESIRQYIPEFKYILIDVARIDDELLNNLKDSVSYLFRLDKTDIRKKDEAALRIIVILKEVKSADSEIFTLLGRYISELLLYRGVEINEVNDYISDRGENMLAQSIDDLYEEGKQKGMLEGKLEGKLEGILELVKKMLSEGLDIKMISHISGLSVSEINKINL